MIPMRESRKGEKTHLPPDSTELWLGVQKVVPSQAEHRNPPEDSYEAWVNVQVTASRRHRTKRRSI